jgi:DNA processing protein
MSSLKYWVWLSSVSGVGSVTVTKLLERFGTPDKVYNARAEELREVPGLKTAEISLLLRKDLEAANKILARCSELGCHTITPQDSNYPDRLRNIYAPPIVLYVRGRLPIVDDEAAIAIVGTRKCTPYGLSTAEELGYTLAGHGMLVVTGLARGIDTAAARGALRAGGQVIGVIGSGVNIIYPPENAGLFNDIAASGAVVSEYPPDTPAIRANFPARNRIISGLSLGVAVLESPAKSGALITAARALEQNRDVFAMPGNVDAKTCAGSNALLREGAIPVLSAKDIIAEYAELFPDKIVQREKNDMEEKPDEYGFADLMANTDNSKRKSNKIVVDNEPSVDYILMKLVENLVGDERTVAETIGLDNLHVDEIIVKSGLSASQTLTTLTMLEIKGLAENQGGNYFKLTQKELA